MEDEIKGCGPAANVLGVDSIECDECPFPFCVTAEANIIKAVLREQLARIMQKLGNSTIEIARAMNTTTRTVYRYRCVHEDPCCVWCNLTRSQNVMCKSDVCTVVCENGQYTVILNMHRHATGQELKVVKFFIEYTFPSSIVEKSTSDHDYWMLKGTELEEAERFQGMCNALNTYILSLGGGAKCLQQTR